MPYLSLSCCGTTIRLALSILAFGKRNGWHAQVRVPTEMNTSGLSGLELLLGSP